MASLVFDKYEGLGNDFIVVDASSEQDVRVELARALCDRHLGIGADGVILVLAPRTAGSRASMVVLNADGTRPEMCGNGLRCVALHLARRQRAVAESLVVDTDAGPLGCDVERHGDTASVRTSMGRAQVHGQISRFFAGRQHSLTHVSIGNPHAVLFDASYEAAEIDGFAPEISASLPGGSNVEIARLSGPRSIALVVWERGVGRTLACGTGAAATAVAACTLGRSPFDEPLSIVLPGGALEVEVARSLDVRLRGPARRVFSGEVTR